MRIVDKNALSEMDYFWMTIGVLQGKAWVARRQNEDIEIEAGAKVVEALRKQGAAEAGKAAYYLGIKLVIDYELSAAGEKADEAAKHELMLKIGEVSLVKVNVIQEKRKVTKKAIVEHDKEGRILSWVEFEDQVQI